MTGSDSIFTDQDMTVRDYRSFSPFSLFAFLFSVIVSMIAWLNYNLLFLAALGVLFALISIGKLISRRGRSTGYVLSGLALALPLFSIAGPITYHRLRLQQLVNTSIRYSETWLELVQQGKVHEPYELTLTRFVREKKGADLAVAHGPLDAPNGELDSYLKNQPETSIREDGDRGKFKRIGPVMYDKEPRIAVENFKVLYEYLRPNGDRRMFALILRRQEYSSGNAVFWNILVSNVEPKESRIVYGGDRSGATEDAGQ